MFYEKTHDGVKLCVKVTPKASANMIRGVEGMAQGQQALKISVTSVPEDGKANIAVINLLAKSLKIAKSHISVLQGETSKLKTLHIAGDTKILIAKIKGIVS
jgi:uncharacterized protein (TIGR00251 family)